MREEIEKLGYKKCFDYNGVGWSFYKDGITIGYFPDHTTKMFITKNFQELGKANTIEELNKILGCETT